MADNYPTYRVKTELPLTATPVRFKDAVLQQLDLAKTELEGIAKPVPILILVVVLVAIYFILRAILR